MKILIDDLLLEGGRTQEQVTVVINGNKMQGYQVGKPLNYDKKYCTLWKRLSAAILVFRCKAIAVQYFTDLSEEEQQAYVKTKLSKPEKIKDLTINQTLNDIKIK